MSIPFTQYLRPDGRAKWVEFETTPDQAELDAAARRIIAAGYRFECEELSTGDVSFTIVGLNSDCEEADLAIEVVANGPAVVAAIERLVAKGIALVEGRAAAPSSMAAAAAWFAGRSKP